VRIVHPQSGRYVVYDHISVDNFQDERRLVCIVLTGFCSSRVTVLRSHLFPLATHRIRNRTRMKKPPLIPMFHFNELFSNRQTRHYSILLVHCGLLRLVRSRSLSEPRMCDELTSKWKFVSDAFETGAARWSDSFYLRHLNTHKLLGIAATGELFVGDGFRSDPRDFQLTLSAVSRALDARANAVISMTNGFLIGRQVSCLDVLTCVGINFTADCISRFHKTKE